MFEWRIAPWLMQLTYDHACYRVAGVNPPVFICIEKIGNISHSEMPKCCVFSANRYLPPLIHTLQIHS